MAKLLQDTAMMDPTALKINMFKCRLIYSWHQKPKKKSNMGFHSYFYSKIDAEFWIYEFKWHENNH